MVNFKSLLSRLFCCLCVLNCFVLGRFGVGRLQIGHVALSFLWQFLRWGQSQDARGCLAVTDRFWLGNKTNHHSHLLHHFFQSCFLIEDRKRKHNKLPSFFLTFSDFLSSSILADLNLWIFRTYLIATLKNPIFILKNVHFQQCFPHLTNDYLTHITRISFSFAHWREYTRTIKIIFSLSLLTPGEQRVKFTGGLALEQPWKSLKRRFQQASVLTRLSAGWPRLARRVTLMWLFFSSQLSICFTLVMRSWAAMPCEKVSSFTCTGAVEGIKSAPFQILNVRISAGQSLFISSIWWLVKYSPYVPAFDFCFSRTFNCSSWICLPVISLYKGGSLCSLSNTNLRPFSSMILMTSERCMLPMSSPISLMTCIWRCGILRPTAVTVARARGSRAFFFFSTGTFPELPASVENGTHLQDEAVMPDLTVHIPSLDADVRYPTLSAKTDAILWLSSHLTPPEDMPYEGRKEQFNMLFYKTIIWIF